MNPIKRLRKSLSKRKLLKQPTPCLEQLKRLYNIPDNDFSEEKFDTPNSPKVNRYLLLISTPRSGSTMVCDLLNKNYGILMHEYFHPTKLMHYMGARWKSLNENGTVNLEKYVKALSAHRTSKDGILGINIHRSHLSIFSEALQFFDPETPIQYTSIHREDLAKQAISFFIAQKTGKWSSEFSPESKAPQYSYRRILRHYQNFTEDNQIIEQFLKDKAHQTMSYESICKDKKAIIPCFGLQEQESFQSSSLQRQKNSLNEAFYKRFLEDHSSSK